jgi:hypothetical protein
MDEKLFGEEDGRPSVALKQAAGSITDLRRTGNQRLI